MAPAGRELPNAAQEFYALLEAALRRREVPEIEIEHAPFRESGLLSDQRDYLRLTRGTLRFDCCAAPFGTGFLFSYWLWFLPRPFTLFHFLGLLTTVGFLGSAMTREYGLVHGLEFLLAGLAILFVIVRSGIFRRQRSVEHFLQGLSVFGVIYELIFRPPTYFELDTAYAFNVTVRNSLIEVLDGLAQTHSLRALTEDERKPVMRDFYQKRRVRP